MATWSLRRVSALVLREWARTDSMLGAEVTGDVMSHYIWGPRRPSWGIEMTLISSFMRNANRHAQLADVVSTLSPEKGTAL
jgi:hypothetical protein